MHEIDSMLLTPVSFVDTRREALHLMLEQANERTITSKEFLRLLGEKLLEIHVKLTTSDIS